MNHDTDTWPYPFWIAHRGAGQLAPENTLAAFCLGHKYGWRMFECDVQLSADGVLFLLHDLKLDRTTSGHGLASSHNWQTLSILDAGSWHSIRYIGERLIKLEDVARYCLAHNCLLNLEIKPGPGLEAQTATALARAVTQLWPAHATAPFITSFSMDALLALRQAPPQLRRGLLLDKFPDDPFALADQLGCVALVCQYQLWNPTRIASAHLAGLRALAYTVNDVETVQRSQAWGIDGVITDRVDFFDPQTKTP